MVAMAVDKEVEEALEELKRTYVGPGQCFLPEYIEAYNKYQRVLAGRGIINLSPINKQKIRGAKD